MIQNKQSLSLVKSCFKQDERTFIYRYSWPLYVYLLYCFDPRHKFKGFHRTPSPDIPGKVLSEIDILNKELPTAVKPMHKLKKTYAPTLGHIWQTINVSLMEDIRTKNFISV